MAAIINYLARPSDDSPERMDRHIEMTGRDRDDARDSAAREGIELSDEHWKVIIFLRRYYLDHGWQARPHQLSRELDKAFAEQGGARYLYRLFPHGPLAQGARIAGLPVPANVTNDSFGYMQ
jgi:tRNA 2-thiouridine synthesizing protein E